MLNRAECFCFFLLASSSSIPVSSSINIARNKTTWGSSYYVYGNGNLSYAYLAVDGSRASNIMLCFCSGTGDANSWWAVDLGSLTDVFGAALTNRGDCCGKIKYIIEILRFHSNTVKSVVSYFIIYFTSQFKVNSIAEHIYNISLTAK